MAAHKREKSEPAAAAPVPREKLVRDSFTLPDSDYRLIGVLKHRLLASGVEAKKSEVVRAGLRLLDSLDDAAVRAAFERIERIKAGRPAKGKKVSVTRGPRSDAE